MKFDLIIFTTVTLSSDVVGVFRRNESVAIRGRVRAGGVQKLLDVHHGGGAAAGQARRRGSDGLAAGHRSSRAVNEILRNFHNIWSFVESTFYTITFAQKNQLRHHAQWASYRVIIASLPEYCKKKL